MDLPSEKEEVFIHIFIFLSGLHPIRLSNPRYLSTAIALVAAIAFGQSCSVLLSLCVAYTAAIPNRWFASVIESNAVNI
jgi:hypothetical protein